MKSKKDTLARETGRSGGKTNGRAEPAPVQADRPAGEAARPDGRALRILLVEDSENDAELLLHDLRLGGYSPEHERVETSEQMSNALDKQVWDIIISDYALPRFSGPEAIALAKNRKLDTPIIIVSGTIGEETAVKCMRAGANDYIIKGQLARLVPAIEREVRDAEARRRSAQEETRRQQVMLGLMEDLRDSQDRLKKAMAELEKARDAALETARFKSEFLANMSHEIRTPLNAVIGLSGLLKDAGLMGQQREYVDTLNMAGQTLMEIVNQILDFSKAQAGKLALDQTDFDPRQPANDALTLVSTRAQDKGLTLSSDFSDDLPARVKGDPGRFKQMLLNLLGNAVKFTEKGAVNLSLEKTGEADGCALLKATVKDTGIGVTEEQKKKLFEPFIQANAGIAGKFGGTGLGLALVKEIAGLMGGEVGVESAPGQGSTFWFSMKLKMAEAPAAVPQAPAAPLAVPTVRPHFRVLVADDNPINQQVAKAQLERLGYIADTVPDGQAAVEAVQTGTYQLVLMDCRMPVMDGLAASVQIRKSDKMLPIIALTADTMEEDKKRCLEAGMSDFLPKPVTMEALAEVMVKWDVPVEKKLLKSLRSFGEEQEARILNQVVGRFIEKTPERIKALLAAAQEGNAKALEDSAHFIKGSAAQFGARGLSILCGRIETLARAGRQAEVTDLLEAVEAEFEYFKKHMQEDLRKLVDKLGAGALKNVVLIVDDEEPVRQVFKRVLPSVCPDAEVHEAVNGFEAGQKVMALRPFLVVMDIRLPGMDGISVCRALRKDARLDGVKILVITGFPSPEIEQQAREAGADDFLAKPPSLDEITARLQTLVRQARPSGGR